MKFLSVVLALVLVAGSMDADAARRIGGGGSMGRQSSNVTQREATRNTPPANTPAQQQQGAAAQQGGPAGAAAGAAAQQRRTPWGGILGGLAAGLGLAWLANALGLGAGFAQFLMFALLALVLFAVIGMIMRRRGAAPAQRGYAFPGGPAPQDVAAAPRQYNPDKVGNDASARPWERNSMAFDAAKFNQGGQMGNLRIGSGLGGSQSWGVPADFDAAGFLEAAKRNFITLQAAWDRGDVAGLRAMMTDEMLGEIRNQLAQREREASGQPGAKTEVVMLEAQLLGIEELADEYMASVEFSGMIREEPSAGPSPFREVWNMTKPRKGGGGWLVAGVQALQ